MAIELGSSILLGIVKMFHSVGAFLFKVRDFILNKDRDINSLRIHFASPWTYGWFIQKIDGVEHDCFHFAQGVFIVTNCTSSIITVHTIYFDTRYIRAERNRIHVTIPSGGKADFLLQGDTWAFTIDEIFNTNITIEYNVGGGKTKTTSFKYQGPINLK